MGIILHIIILHSHPCIAVHLKVLFSIMLNHACVPNAFGYDIVIPIVKDKRGDLSSLDNYRPITLSPVISKIFESMLLVKLSLHFNTDDLQFGFKPGLGCSNAIFALRQVVEFLTSAEVMCILHRSMPVRCTIAWIILNCTVR